MKLKVWKDKWFWTHWRWFKRNRILRVGLFGIIVRLEFKARGPVTAKHINECLIELFEEDYPEELKKAVTEFVRMRMREEGFLRKLIPSSRVPDDALDKQVNTD